MINISGIVERIIFSNSENGYSVFVFDVDDEIITCTGNIFNLMVGEELELIGDMVFHERFGEQFSFSSFNRKKEPSLVGLINYLKNGNIPYIKAKMASKIIDIFGEDTARILEEEPERLIEVPGIGRKSLDKIITALDSEKDARRVYIELAEYGIYGAAAEKIYRSLGSNSIDIIKADPYRLIKLVRGFGFLKADEIALKLGFEKNDPIRIRSAVIYLLYMAELDGHMFLYQEELEKSLKELLGDFEKDGMNQIYVDLVISGDIIRMIKEDGTRIYSNYMHEIESEAARLTADLILKKNARIEMDEELDQDINRHFSESSVKYDDEQKKAIIMALKNNISIITGGPGTGKTTIVRAILEIARMRGKDIRLAAPTGRAAKRLEGSSGGTAMTLHRLLKLRPKYDDEYMEPVEELDCDMVLVDEMSMVDTELYKALLDALGGEASLILVGDSDQLPSVGAGNVLKDLLEVEEIPKIRLNKIYRTLDTSEIAIASRDIREGNVPKFNQANGDVFFMNETNEDEFVDEILELVEKRLPNYYGFNSINDIQILIPTKKGNLGTENLNRLLQERLNSEERYISFRNQKFKLGDKVMQITNNYERKISYKNHRKDDETGVFNGDIGIITEIDPFEGKLVVLFSDDYYAIYEEKDLSELKLAYAITVHKSQGSEFPCVIFIAWRANYLLNNRNLLYTGVTRAKELLVVMGRPETFNTMLKNTRIERRNSGLKSSITEVLVIAKELSNMR